MSKSPGSLLRSLPHFKGKHRLSRLLFRNLIENGRDLQIQGLGNCSYLLPNLQENLAFDIFINGIYEQETNDFLVATIPQGATVLDIGANIGSISIPLAKKRKDIRIVCVEASPFVFEYLKRNIALNGLDRQIQVHNVAITDADNLQLPFYSDPGTFGKGSLSPVFTHEAVMVNGISLDSFIRHHQLGNIGFIKIDIEGYEYFAFKGASQLLNRTDRPGILLEFVDWAEEHANLEKGSAQQLLMQFGYRLHLLEGNNISTPVTQAIRQGSAMLVAS